MSCALAVIGTQASMARTEGRFDCADQLEEARATVERMADAVESHLLAVAQVREYQPKDASVPGTLLEHASRTREVMAAELAALRGEP